MKAAVYQGNKTFSLGRSEPIRPGPGEVRLNVAYCGVCGTDVHIYHGQMDHRITPPQVIGHEVSGEVAEVGEGVADVAPGDRVAVRPVKLGRPEPSDKGFTHVGKNAKLFGVDLPGGMQGSWTVPTDTLHKLPKSVSLVHGALVEPIAVACHDVSLGEVRSGESCVVLGAGPIGLLIALVARRKGARVILSEINPGRARLAQSLGLETVNPTEDHLVERVSRATGEAMADVVFEVSGSAAGAESMTQVANVRGRIVMVAIHPQPRPVSLFRFFWSELRMIGARLYEPKDFEEAIRIAAGDELPLDRLITQVRPIDETPRVFQTIDADPDGMKYLIRCNA